MNKDYAFGFMIGLGYGIGIALLFAPKSGEEARSLIVSKTREGKDYLMQQAAELHDSAADVIEKGREDVMRHKEGLKRAVEAGNHILQDRERA